jgi:flagellar biosynthetic protein FlhB
MTGENRTEKATPRRREEARRKGQVARSVEVNTAAVLLAALAVLALLGPKLLRDLQVVVRDGLLLASQPERVDVEGLPSLARWGLGAFALVVAPIAVAALVAGVLASVAQVRFRITPQALQPSLRKLDPVQGLKRVLGPQGLFEGVKAIVKTAIVGLVAFLALWPELPALGALTGVDPAAIPGVLGGIVLRVGLKSVAALALVAAADFAFQRWRHEKQLRMSKDEVKREMRQTDVAPEVRQAIRRRQYEQARRRMLADVPTADVVVTNPTHYAVALRYDGSKPAPEVVARGVDHVAAAIRSVAEAHGVPLLSNPPLARALYREVDLGETIPEQFFAAVAEVLAFVYRTSGRRRRSERGGAGPVPALN